MEDCGDLTRIFLSPRGIRDVERRFVDPTHLDLLASAADGVGRVEEARRLRSLKGRPLVELIDALSQIERTPQLELELWHAIVLFKACLAGKPKEEEFVRACWKAQGLL